MALTTGRLFQLIWLGVAVQIGGEIVDLRWHATHDEFEGAGQQVEAHWLIWVGTLVTLAPAAIAAKRLRPGSTAGLLLALAAGAIYVATSVWHFAAHASGVDPEAAHILLGVAKVGILAGVVWATVLWRATRPEG
jgi:hypothetical protein